MVVGAWEKGREGETERVREQMEGENVVVAGGGEPMKTNGVEHVDCGLTCTV